MKLTDLARPHWEVRLCRGTGAETNFYIAFVRQVGSSLWRDLIPETSIERATVSARNYARANGGVLQEAS